MALHRTFYIFFFIFSISGCFLNTSIRALQIATSDDSSNSPPSGGGGDSGGGGGSSAITPEKLVITGPSSILQSACRRFLVSSQSLGSIARVVSSDTIVTLSGQGSGSFYSDEYCSTTTSSVTIKAGTSEAWIYLKNGTLESLTLSATYSVLVGTKSTSIVGPAFSWHTTIANGAATPPNPPGLIGHKAVYHDKRQSMIIYGGDLQIGVGTKYTAIATYGGMWEYASGAWTLICNPCAPGPRFGHGFVYDSFRNKIVLIGGGNSSTAYYNDVWEWDGSTWTEVTNTISGTGPSPRRESFAAYDNIRHRTVIFGGELSTSTLTAEVYEYDGTSWYGPFLPATRPSIRSSETATTAFDPKRGLTYFYGSNNGDADLWAWNGSTWLDVCGGNCTPVGRAVAGFTFDISQDKIYLATGWWTSTFDEIWEMNAATHAWTFLGTSPFNGDAESLIWNPETGRVIFFGGNLGGPGGNGNGVYEYGNP